MTALDEYSRLQRVALRSPRQAFVDQRLIDAEWHALGFTAPPDLGRAEDQFAAFEHLIGTSGAEVVHLSTWEGLTLDALYVRDASIVTPRGVVLCGMGKFSRQVEPSVQGEALAARGFSSAGAIEPPGRLEGGDVVWFDARTVAIGQGYRTNAEGIRQFRSIAGPEVSVTVVALPHYRGPSDVFHLMSIVSPVDADLAVVYSPLMPVPFRDWLQERGIALVEVPDEEFDSMGANVLAIAPRWCVMLDGNPVTRARLEEAGARVEVYDGSEISIKGGGGPTCLTRPLVRGDLTLSRPDPVAT